MMNATMTPTALEDAPLIERSLAGDREAFGQLVERYQGLICALAYSACGDLSRSEDIAQETFVTAWRRLGSLRDRRHLRPWLCGIARHVASHARRRQTRQPETGAQGLEAMGDAPGPEPTPAEAAARQEEAALVWECLGRLPGALREPLILFYREQRSVQQVAVALELSEEAVRQRLSRGRALLRERLTAVVETTLANTRPGKVFTLAVLAALPLITPQAAAAGLAAMAGKGSPLAGAALSTSLLGAVGGSLLGLWGAYMGTRASLQQARSDRERAFIKRYVGLLGAVILGFIVSLLPLLAVGRSLLRTHPGWFVFTLGFGTLAYAVAVALLALLGARRHRQIQQEDEASGLAEPLPAGVADAGPPGWEYRTRTCLLGLPLVHLNFGGGACGRRQRGVARGWIAVGDIAYGLLFASGGIAVGGIAVGGLAAGLLALGGCAVGGLVLGGFALGAGACGGGAFGWLAAGGLAVGWAAFGGGALGWHAAYGGFAWARDYAVGGTTFAAHTNDALAREFFASHPFFTVTKTLLTSLAAHQTRFVVVVLALSFAPTLVLLWLGRRRRLTTGGPAAR